MKRSGFKQKTYQEKVAKLKNRAKRSKLASKGVSKKKVQSTVEGVELQTYPQRIKKSKRGKSPLKKLKEQLWKLCREIQIKRFGSDCYTCPAKDLSGSNRHLGHFISSSVCSTELRYSLDNLKIQCYSCNIHKSGNWLAYERHLIADGVDVQELKDRNEKTKGGMFREDWYEQKITEYQAILESL